MLCAANRVFAGLSNSQFFELVGYPNSYCEKAHRMPFYLKRNSESAWRLELKSHLQGGGPLDAVIRIGQIQYHAKWCKLHTTGK